MLPGRKPKRLQARPPLGSCPWVAGDPKGRELGGQQGGRPRTRTHTHPQDRAGWAPLQGKPAGGQAGGREEGRKADDAMCPASFTSSLGFLLSLSPSTRTRTTPDLSTISWMTFPFLPITFPAGKTKAGNSGAAHEAFSHILFLSLSASNYWPSSPGGFRSACPFLHLHGSITALLLADGGCFFKKCRWPTPQGDDLQGSWDREPGPAASLRVHGKGSTKKAEGSKIIADMRLPTFLRGPSF